MHLLEFLKVLLQVFKQNNGAMSLSSREVSLYPSALASPTDESSEWQRVAISLSVHGKSRQTVILRVCLPSLWNSKNFNSSLSFSPFFSAVGVASPVLFLVTANRLLSLSLSLSPLVFLGFCSKSWQLVSGAPMDHRRTYHN